MAEPVDPADGSVLLVDHVWLVYMPPEGRDSTDAAVATVERLARAAVAEIVLD